MDFNEMQAFLNALELEFVVFVYPEEKEIVLRIPYDVPIENPEYKDITYDLNGKYLKSI